MIIGSDTARIGGASKIITSNFFLIFVTRSWKLFDSNISAGLGMDFPAVRR